MYFNKIITANDIIQAKEKYSDDIEYMDVNDKRTLLLITHYGFNFKVIPKSEIIRLIEEEITTFVMGSSNYIRTLCGYLYCIGDISDVALIKKAKYNINFDVGCMIDSEWIDSLENYGIETDPIRSRDSIINSFISDIDSFFY